MLTAIALILLATTPPAPAVTPAVDVGRFDETTFPAATLRNRRMPYDTMLTRIETILRERQCRLEGQSHRNYDIRVPYVVMLEPDGTPTRFVVADIGCQPIESWVGRILLELARNGDFRPTGASEAGWYGNQLRFSVGSIGN
ncbi:MAG TPA: hypothetical protein VF577_05540 [Allosphingosinicella sp.]|jgi:hypothetical protein